MPYHQFDPKKSEVLIVKMLNKGKIYKKLIVSSLIVNYCRKHDPTDYNKKYKDEIQK